MKKSLARGKEEKESLGRVFSGSILAGFQETGAITAYDGKLGSDESDEVAGDGFGKILNFHDTPRIVSRPSCHRRGNKPTHEC